LSLVILAMQSGTSIPDFSIYVEVTATNISCSRITISSEFGSI